MVVGLDETLSSKDFHTYVCTHDCVHVPLFLNYSCAEYLVQAEQDKPHPRVVPTPCVCAIILVGMAQHSMAQPLE